MVNMTGGTEPVHVTGFVPHAEANRAHHMLLYACPMPMSEPGIPYDCMHHAMCRGGQSIMFAWAKNAPPTTLPQASVSWSTQVSDDTLSFRFIT